MRAAVSGFVLQGWPAATAKDVASKADVARPQAS